MGHHEGREEKAGGPAEERVEVGEVDFGERSGRSSGGAAEGFQAPGAPRRTARTVSPADGRVANFTGEQRLLLLDAGCGASSRRRSSRPGRRDRRTRSTPGGGSASRSRGPAGLLGQARGSEGSRLPEPTRRAILMLKEAHPDWGQDRIHDMLIRTEGFAASPGAIAAGARRGGLRGGGGADEAATRQGRSASSARAERAMADGPVHLHAQAREPARAPGGYLDDYSRFLVGFGLHASASGALVREVLRERRSRTSVRRRRS